MRRGLASAAAAACVLAGCGGDDLPTARDVAECLHDAGASVVYDPGVDDDPSSPGFTPTLTPLTELFAEAELGETEILVFSSMAAAAGDAEDRALEYLRLFGRGRDDLLRSGTTLVMLRGRV